MSSLTVSLYEFGLFLEILLWIFIPVSIIAILVTTFLHYRQKRRLKEIELPAPAFALQLWDAPDGDISDTDAIMNLIPEEEDERNIYRGLLWMKEKYEEYREQADLRYEKLKDELRQTRARYEELTSGIVEGKEQGFAKSNHRQSNMPNRGQNSPVSGSVSHNGKPILPKDEDGTAERALIVDNLIVDTLIVDNESAGFEDMAIGSVTENEMSAEGNLSAAWLKEACEGEELTAQALVGEKDRQIIFLQGQLDQRIRTYFQLEYQGREDRCRLEELQAYYDEALNLLDERQQVLADRQLLVQVQQATIRRLRRQLQEEETRSLELSLRLEKEAKLIMNIYKALDRSLHRETKIPAPDLEAREPELVGV